MKFSFLGLAGFLLAGLASRAADLPALWAERAKAVVAIEYVIETELDRRPGTSYGLVVDAQGTIIVPNGAIDSRVEPSQLKDFKVYTPDDPVSSPGTYLGQDGFTGWHFIRADEKLRARLTPITAFVAKGPAPTVALAESVWGIGLRAKDEDFMPYLMTSQVALIQSLPPLPADVPESLERPKAQQTVGRGRSQCDQQARLHDVDLRAQIRQAVTHFILGRGAIADLRRSLGRRQLRAPVHDVADINVTAREPHATDHFRQQLTGGADKRFPLHFLVRSRRFADKHDFGIEAADPEDDLLARADMSATHRVIPHEFKERVPACGFVSRRQGDHRRCR